MYPRIENTYSIEARQGASRQPKEMLRSSCSYCGKVFQGLHVANAAQHIGVEFARHNAKEHEGLATLGSLEPVWVA